MCVNLRCVSRAFSSSFFSAHKCDSLLSTAGPPAPSPPPVSPSLLFRFYLYSCESVCLWVSTCDVFHAHSPPPGVQHANAIPCFALRALPLPPEARLRLSTFVLFVCVLRNISLLLKCPLACLSLSQHAHVTRYFALQALQLPPQARLRLSTFVLLYLRVRVCLRFSQSLLLICPLVCLSFSQHANVIRYFALRALQLPPQAWLRLSTVFLL